MYSVLYRSHVDPSGFCNNVVWVLVDLTLLCTQLFNPEDESTKFPRTLVSTYKPKPCQSPWDNDLKNTCQENPKTHTVAPACRWDLLFTCQIRLRWNLCHQMEFPSDSTKTSRDKTENFPVVHRPSNSGVNSKYDGVERTPSGEFSTHLGTRLVFHQYAILQKGSGRTLSAHQHDMHKIVAFWDSCIWHLITGLGDHASKMWGNSSLTLELWSNSHSTDSISWKDSTLFGRWASEPEKSVILTLLFRKEQNEIRITN
jgi:hypothetical protein